MWLWFLGAQPTPFAPAAGIHQQARKLSVLVVKLFPALHALFALA